MTGESCLWYIGPRRFALFLLLLSSGFVRSADDRPVTVVGMQGHIDGIVLPGPELEVRPLENSQAPFVLRIARVQPQGTAFRYDFVYYGLEPRTYDLTQYLRPKKGSASVKLPTLEVEVRGLLGPGLIHPHALEPKRASWFAGYRVALLAGAVLWILGFFFILLRGRKKKWAAKEAVVRETVADRLRPLVIRAMAGTLSSDQMAELERTLLAFWRHRLGLENDKAPVALAKMRQHPEAGVLLNQLELWLHRPGTREQVDVGKLLWPYQLTAPSERAGAAATEEVVA
jgi:hypothetical protein